MATQNVYVISKGKENRELLAVKGSLEAAQEFVSKREGLTPKWEEHNGHGQYWETEVKAGRTTPMTYFIEHFELED